MNTILVYDDDGQRTKKFRDKLQTGLKKANQHKEFEVIPLSDDEFQRSIEGLQQRQIKFRSNKEIHLEDGPEDEAKKIDKASILIIDYDLLGNQEEKSSTGFLTGEIIAYLVRCFSKCKLIIGLNQYGNNPFDLTLRGHPESFADLNLGEDQLSNSDLWKGDWGDSRRGYRPWSWPNLSDFLCDFGKRVKDVQESLGKPICEVLDPDFGPELFQSLPREIIRFIGKYEEKEILQTTFREFVTKSGNGLKSKDADASDNNTNRHILARIGAARVSKWLERLVLPAQNILVDAPHLVLRYPSLLDGDDKKIGTWNKTAQLIDHYKLGLDVDLIAPYRFKNDYWISRPVWFWSKLRECENIPEVAEPWLIEKPDWVFCEDASRFYNQKYCQEFLAHTISPFTRRFVRHFKKVNNKIVKYKPEVQFWL